MLEFIAIHRLPFVVLFAILLTALVWRGGWRTRLMGTASGVMAGSAVVMIAILFNASQLWWLPPNQQTPLNIDVPSLLKPVVEPIEAIAAGQLHVEAALVAMKFFAYYTISAVVAMIVITCLMIWQYMEFRHEVHFVRQALKNNPQLLNK